MAKYKLTRNDSIIRLEDNAAIPMDIANRDYAQYLEDRKQGEVPEPADPTPVEIPPTPAEKLAAAGLTVEDLKSLLGIK